MIAVETFYRTRISELVFYGHFNPPFVVDHLVSNVLLYGTRMVLKKANDWP